MTRIGFGIAALASLVLAAWFVIVENESPGLSFGIALIAMPMLTALFGLSHVKGNGITKDGKGAGWAAVVIAVLGVGYQAAFFGPWLPVAMGWLALHIPMIIGLVSSPTVEG